MLNSTQVQKELKFLKNKKQKLLEDSKQTSQKLEDLLTIQKYIQDTIGNKLKEIQDKTVPIVNEFLNTTFPEEELTFEFTSSVKYGKASYTPSLLDKRTGIRGDTEDFGGGVLTVASVVLRMLFILLSKAPRLLVLDETLNPVSPKYRVKVSEFLSTLAKELDFKIVLITFDENDSFSSNATNVYEAQLKNNNTIYKKIK